MEPRVFINNRGRSKSITEVGDGMRSSLANGKRSRINDTLDLMDAVYTIPYLMAAGGVVARGVIGPGFDIVQRSLDIKGSKLKRKKLLEFFSYTPKVPTNIRDTYGPLSKIYTTAFSFRMFGHSAWEIVTDKGGKPIGFNFLPGVIRPNIEKDGRFKSPAYTQYLRSGAGVSKQDIMNPANIIYFSIPDFSGGVWMEESLALTDYSLPSEIYAARAFRAMHENRNAPHSGIWYTPEDVDKDTFDNFVSVIKKRYAGPDNYGRNPIIMKGKGGYEPLSLPNDEAPYKDGREIVRHEVSATVGVPGPKYGADLDQIGGNSLSELRREFYESLLRPVMSLLEEAIYIHVCVRLFDAPEWSFKFGRPDFTTAVEDASIELRRIQWGQWSPNEARRNRGEVPRDGGDYYLIPANMNVVDPDAKPGPPDNDPVDDNQGDLEPSEEDPVPDTQPPERTESFSNAIEELKKWQRFAVRVAQGKRYGREFIAEFLPDAVTEKIREYINSLGNDAEGIHEMFEMFIDELED